MTSYFYRARYALLLLAFGVGAAALLIIYRESFESLPIPVQATLVLSAALAGMWMLRKDRKSLEKK